jgi:hypothetical protein
LPLRGKAVKPLAHRIAIAGLAQLVEQLICNQFAYAGFALFYKDYSFIVAKKSSRLPLNHGLIGGVL